MKSRFLITVFLFCLLAAGIFPQNKDNPLVGHWITNVLKQQKTKITMTFNAKGNVEYEVAVPLRGHYLTKGTTLITMFENPKTGSAEIDTSRIEIKGNTLYQINYVGVRKNVIKSTRVKKGTGLTGTWLSKNYNGYHARQQFTQYNSLFVDLIVKSINGKYTVSGNEFTIESKDNPDITISYTINQANGHLVISRPGLDEKIDLVKVNR